MSGEAQPRLFTDESVYGPTVVALVSAGFDIVRAVDVCAGAPDHVVAHTAYSRQRVLVTEDFDFGQLIVRDKLPALGVMLIALNQIAVTAKPGLVVSAVVSLGSGLFGTFNLIEEGRIRSRPLPT
jgi:predicted nuclease of predicted toxin-antitoxin system